MLPKNPNYFGSSVIPTPFPLGQTVYLINRLPGETIVPWDSSNIYYDNEYQSEFGVPASSASWQSVYSVWDNNVQGIPGPLFKWVRINAVTEVSLYLDVNSDSVFGSNHAHLLRSRSSGLQREPMVQHDCRFDPPSTATQVLEITALAALPNGSKKILQYLVAR